MRLPLPLRLPLLVVIALGLAGCATVHTITIDAISDRSKPLGASYRLQIEDPTGGVEPAVHATAVEAVKNALGARGLYEAPPNTTPDMVVEASYGIGHGYVKIVHQQNPDLVGTGIIAPPQAKAVVVYDKMLELTARAPRAAGSREPGAELWSVKAKIADNKQALEPYLEPLASACIDYIGVNPGREVVVSLDRAQAQGLLQRRPDTPAAAPESAQNR